MTDFKQLAENILDGIMGNASITDILLKAKIFAVKKGDKELVEWIACELEGYENKPPKYRIITCGIKVDVFVPFRGITRIEFPADIISEKIVSERLANIVFHNPISEIRALSMEGNEAATINMRIPVAAYGYMSDYIRGNIQDAFQYTSKASIQQIIVAVKTILIDYFLKIRSNEDIDFNTFINNKASMITNINAGIVNMGNGNINAQGSTNVVGDNNTISADNKTEILKILGAIDHMADTLENKCEYKEVSDDIKSELNKPTPSTSYIKRCFQAIPALLANLGTSILANQLDPLVASALALL